MSLVSHLVTLLHHHLLLHVAEVRGKDVRLLQLRPGPGLPLTFLLDFLLGQCVICPLVTMCWRSVWLLADCFFDRLLPGKKTLGFIISLALGTSLTIIFRFINFVPSTCLSSISTLAQLCVTRLFSVIYFCCYIMLWRGWWNLLDLLSPSCFLLLSPALCVQLVTRSLPSNVGPPLSFSHDSKHYLRLPVFTQCTSPLLNIVTTSLLEVFVILCWFSTWTLLDAVMEEVSASTVHNIVLSLSLGLVSGLLAFTLQLPLLCYIKFQSDPGTRTRNNTTFYCQHFATNLFHDFLCLLGLASTVASLRGFWMFLDFVFHDNLWLSMTVPGVIGFSSLLSLKLFSSLHGGVLVRGGESEASLFPCWLLTFWLVSDTSSVQDSQHHSLLRDNTINDP